MALLRGEFDSIIRSKTNLSEEEAFATVDKRYLTRKFTFQGEDIDLVWSCGLFITMNPGWFLLIVIHLSLSFMSIYFQSRLCWTY